MKIEYIKINGKEHPLCCGLYLLSDLQKEYGSLDKFMEKLTEGEAGSYNFDVIINTLKRMNACGAKAIDTEPITELELEMATNPYKIIEKLCQVYMNAMMPENPEE